MTNTAFRYALRWHDVSETVGRDLDEDTRTAVQLLEQRDQRLEAWLNRLPWGFVAVGRRTSAQTAISGISDLTGQTVTWTALPGRRYRLRGNVLMLQVTAAGVVDTFITDGAGAALVQSTFPQAAGAFAKHIVEVPEISGLSGSVTYKMRAQTTAGTCEVSASATNPAFIVVDDVGPA